MQIKLFDYETLKLPLFNTVEERKSYLKNNFLNNKKYTSYYFVNCNGLSKLDAEYAEARWIGISSRNKQHCNKHVENILSAMGSYLIFCDELSVKKDVKQYEEHLKKHREISIEGDEILLEFQKRIMYKKIYPVRRKEANVVFMINYKEEERLKSYIKTYAKDKKHNYSEEFMYMDSIRRLQLCNKAKRNCKVYKEEIKESRKKIIAVRKEIKENYEAMKESKNNNREIKNKIIRLCKEASYLERETLYLEKAIELEYKDYCVSTEFNSNY